MDRLRIIFGTSTSRVVGISSQMYSFCSKKQQRKSKEENEGVCGRKNDEEGREKRNRNGKCFEAKPYRHFLSSAGLRLTEVVVFAQRHHHH